jgi:DNA polymerase-3 subunit delta
MKLQARSIPGFIKAPDADVIAVLVYGPNGGLVRERADALMRAVAGKLDDPFLVGSLTGAEIATDPARLMDEAGAIALGGGRRAVRVTGAGDAIGDTLSQVIAAFAVDDRPSPSLIVVEAGELRPAGKLRKLFEPAKRAAAIPCYLDEARDLAQLVTEILGRHKLRPHPDATAWLVAHLGADRRVTRGELEKLALYAAGQSEVGIDDCRAVIGDAAASDLEQIMFAATGGEITTVDIALSRAFREGANAINIIRAAMRHMQRFHLVCGAVAEGTPIDAALKQLKPPPFFKVADRFRAQARGWPVAHVEAALELLSEAELRCKSTGMPDQLICARALMQIAQAGRRARAR